MAEAENRFIDFVYIGGGLNAGIHEKKGYHFSKKYKYSFVDKDGKDVAPEKVNLSGKVYLKRELNEDYVDDFFNFDGKTPPVEVSAVVGNNGVGKTRLLELLFEALNDAPLNGYPEYLTIICLRNGEVHIFKASERIELRFDEKNIVCLNADLLRSNEHHYVLAPYYTIADDLSGFSGAMLADRSNYGVFHRYNKIAEMDNYKREYTLKDINIINEVKFISAKKLYGEKFRDMFGFDIHFLRMNFQKIDSYIDAYDLTQLEQDALYWIEEESFDRFIDLIAVGCFLNMIRQLKKSYNRGYGEENCFTSIVSEICDSLKERKFTSTYDKVKWLNFQMLSISYNWDKKVHGLSDSLYNIICDFEKMMEFIKNSGEANRDSCDWYNVDFGDNADDDDDFLHFDFCEFMELYANVSDSFDFLEFSWGYSSGEEAKLKLFSRMYSYALDNKTYIPNENLILLIDEADMLLHPEWQRGYVKSVISGMREIFSDAKSIQIIFATHSPLMLSDIPGQNILFLKREGDKIIVDEGMECFAANVFDLLKNAFFLNGSAIGELAEERLQWLLSRILSGETDYSGDLLRNINCIGDRFLRERFMNEYSKHCLDMSEEERLELEIKNAENSLRDKRERLERLRSHKDI